MFQYINIRCILSLQLLRQLVLLFSFYYKTCLDNFQNTDVRIFWFSILVFMALIHQARMQRDMSAAPERVHYNQLKLLH